jgi:hypothetical protein
MKLIHRNPLPSNPLFIIISAGLLTYGSSIGCDLPDPLQRVSGCVMAAGVPVYSGGTVTELHRVPDC